VGNNVVAPWDAPSQWKDEEKLHTCSNCRAMFTQSDHDICPECKHAPCHTCNDERWMMYMIDPDGHRIRVKQNYRPYPGDGHSRKVLRCRDCAGGNLTREVE